MYIKKEHTVTTAVTCNSLQESCMYVNKHAVLVHAGKIRKYFLFSNFQVIFHRPVRAQRAAFGPRAA